MIRPLKMAPSIENPTPALAHGGSGVRVSLSSFLSRAKLILSIFILLILLFPNLLSITIFKAEAACLAVFNQPQVAPSAPADIVQTDGGIVEIIPTKYLKKYLKWKTEYLSTEAGRRQWQAYAEQTNFKLFIIVSKSLNHSAEAGRYEWDENGRLVSATISLGTKIESGYPSTSNYPVTCSLAPSNLPGNVKGAILAAIKLAHEFGHVNHTAIQDIALYQLQNELIPEYNRIFKLNGFHIDDPKLIELARLMRGTPPEISQEREYQAEANVIDYLQERFSRNRGHREMPQPIRQAIESFYGASSGR